MEGTEGEEEGGFTVVTEKGLFRFRAFATSLARAEAAKWLGGWVGAGSEQVEEAAAGDSTPVEKEEGRNRALSDLVSFASFTPPSSPSPSTTAARMGSAEMALLGGSSYLPDVVRRRAKLVDERIDFGFDVVEQARQYVRVEGEEVDLREYWASFLHSVHAGELHRRRMKEREKEGKLHARKGGFPLERSPNVVEAAREGIPLELKGEVWIRLAKGIVEEEEQREEEEASERASFSSSLSLRSSSTPAWSKPKMKNRSSDFGYADSVYYRSLLNRYHLALAKGEDETRSILSAGVSGDERSEKEDRQGGKGNEKVEIDLEQIMKDIHRTFPENPYYKSEVGQKCLRNVLVATAAATAPEVGYAQSMNFVAGVLLVFMSEDDAFSMMRLVVEHLLRGYYGSDLRGVRIDQTVLATLIYRHLSGLTPILLRGMGTAEERDRADKLYTEQNIEKAVHSSMLSFPLRSVSLQWLLSLFVNHLTPTTVLRVWDLFFLSGPSALFRVALSLLFHLTEQLESISKMRTSMLEGRKMREEDVDSEIDQAMFNLLREEPEKIDCDILMSKAEKEFSFIDHALVVEMRREAEEVERKEEEKAIAKKGGKEKSKDVGSGQLWEELLLSDSITGKPTSGGQSSGALSVSFKDILEPDRKERATVQKPSALELLSAAAMSDSDSPFASPVYGGHKTAEGNAMLDVAHSHNVGEDRDVSNLPQPEGEVEFFCVGNVKKVNADRTIEIIDAVKLDAFVDGPAGVKCVAFAASTKFIAIGCDNSDVIGYDHFGKRIFSFAAPSAVTEVGVMPLSAGQGKGATVTTLGVSPAGDLLVVGYLSPSLKPYLCFFDVWKGSTLKVAKTSGIPLKVEFINRSALAIYQQKERGKKSLSHAFVLCSDGTFINIAVQRGPLRNVVIKLDEKSFSLPEGDELRTFAVSPVLKAHVEDDPAKAQPLGAKRGEGGEARSIAALASRDGLIIVIDCNEWKLLFDAEVPKLLAGEVEVNERSWAELVPSLHFLSPEQAAMFGDRLPLVYFGEKTAAMWALDRVTGKVQRCFKLCASRAVRETYGEDLYSHSADSVLTAFPIAVPSGGVAFLTTTATGKSYTAVVLADIDDDATKRPTGYFVVTKAEEVRADAHLVLPVKAITLPGRNGANTQQLYDFSDKVFADEGESVFVALPDGIHKCRWVEEERTNERYENLLDL
uniref:Rab-GAP TBC domain-containing protein n=1 Tax=Palpitomonas bilix TaxID=652834 RepID=A0A7S3GL99_9EUKA